MQSRLSSFFRPTPVAPRVTASRLGAQRQQLCVRAATVAAPAELPVRTLEGGEAGSASLSLRVAEESAKGLVHRYLVYVQASQRRVRRGGANV